MEERRVQREKFDPVVERPAGALPVPGVDGAPIDPGSISIRAAAAIAGDTHALEEVWIEHRRWVAAILLAHKPRWADLEDLLQDVATSFVRKAQEIREPGAIKPWLRTVAVNTAHAAARSGKIRGYAALGRSEREEAPSTRDGLNHDELPPPQRLSARQEGQRLLDLAYQLPDGYREPLLLKAVRGLSYREIGRILDLPETTIETRIARARRQLRELAQQNQVAGGDPD